MVAPAPVGISFGECAEELVPLTIREAFPSPGHEPPGAIQRVVSLSAVAESGALGAPADVVARSLVLREEKPRQHAWSV